jgi:hypothetical protein
MNKKFMASLLLVVLSVMLIVTGCGIKKSDDNNNNNGNGNGDFANVKPAKVLGAAVEKMDELKSSETELLFEITKFTNASAADIEIPAGTSLSMKAAVNQEDLLSKMNIGVKYPSEELQLDLDLNMVIDGENKTYYVEIPDLSSLPSELLGGLDVMIADYVGEYIVLDEASLTEMGLIDAELTTAPATDSELTTQLQADFLDAFVQGMEGTALEEYIVAYENKAGGYDFTLEFTNDNFVDIMKSVMYDMFPALGDLYADEQFAELFGEYGEEALAPFEEIKNMTDEDKAEFEAGLQASLEEASIDGTNFIFSTNKDGYLSGIEVNLNMSTKNEDTGGQDEIGLRFVLSNTDFNEKIDIEIPQDAMTIEELLTELQGTMALPDMPQTYSDFPDAG